MAATWIIDFSLADGIIKSLFDKIKQALAAFSNSFAVTSQQ